VTGLHEPPASGRRLEYPRRSAARAAEESGADVLDLTFSEDGRAWIPAVGWSMFPTSIAGGRLRVAARPEQLACGQVVVYAEGRRLVAHRLVAWTDGRWITKGDGVVGCDPPLEDGHVLAVVERASLGSLGWCVRVDARLAHVSLWLGQACRRRLRGLPRGVQRAVYLALATPVLCLLKVLSWPEGESGEPSAR
jgi:hypothetical protein